MVRLSTASRPNLRRQRTDADEIASVLADNEQTRKRAVAIVRGTRARSNAEFISKIEGGLQELEETQYCVELLVQSGVVTEERLDSLMAEADELTAILVTCAKNARNRNN